jgi:hypothetical protein
MDRPCSTTGGAYTITQKALLQLPIHNYITLNFDAGLTNARDVLYPKSTTSYFFWDQEQSEKIMEEGYKKLVLHLHGRYDRPDSIILTLNDYRNAYHNLAFIRLLSAIFSFKRLIFIGFGRTDPYINHLFNSISKDKHNTPFKHIAFVGLDESDITVDHLVREQVEMIYRARVLFYPAQNNHKALQEWLLMLVEKFRHSPGTSIAEETTPITIYPNLEPILTDKYIHEPIYDDYFIGRSQYFYLLNRLSNDPDTRIIAVTGMGGQGKTALIGRWLKHERNESLANIPVFYWSFYEDPNVEKLLSQIVAFCPPIELPNDKPAIPHITLIIEVVMRYQLIIVLDGLEVLQEDVSSPYHGKFTHPLLLPFFYNWIRSSHKGIMILTSRFHFPQLQSYSGIGYHPLVLSRLNNDEGSMLLKNLNIRGNNKLMEEFTDNLNGHPLALRILATTVKKSCFGDLEQFKGHKIITNENKESLYRKLNHLLKFYEKQLKNGQKEIIGALSYFTRPIIRNEFLSFLSRTSSIKNTNLRTKNELEIERQLEILMADFLIEEAKNGITIHPVIRDYFRTVFKIPGFCQDVADFLTSKPGAKIPKNIEEVRYLVEAVQLLCEDGGYKSADNLFTSRLYHGGCNYDVFKNLPAISEGLVCSMAFVCDEYRQNMVETTLGKDYLAAYFSNVSIYNYFLGNLDQAKEWREKVLTLDAKQKKTDPFDLCNIAFIEISKGELKKASVTIAQALKLSIGTTKIHEQSTILAEQGYINFLLGNIKQAYQDFQQALLFEQKRRPDEQQLYSIEGIQQAEFFIQIQSYKFFKAVNIWNKKSCRKNDLNDNFSYCLLLEGWFNVFVGQLDKAEKALNQAEGIIRPSLIQERICRLDWVWALYSEARNDWQKGLRHVNDALIICADKGFSLWKADNLVLRGRLMLLKYSQEKEPKTEIIEKVGDDGINALKIAENTGYVWAKVTALKLLCTFHRIKSQNFHLNKEKNLEAADFYSKEATLLEKKLKISEQLMKDLAAKVKAEFG